ncbi:hypothetical protein ACFQX9_17070 [Bradyrhizobium sp. GCM10028915]|uniref:hypothetical protein n=1 Tax=Bradyrhizobium sp. GCM10028915 TaxID=3273385 RepID=UPI003620D836
MNTGVNRRIKDEQVVLLRQPCQHSNIPAMTEFIHHSLSNDGRRKTPNWPDRVFPRWLVGSNLQDGIFSISRHNARPEDARILLVK